MCTNGMENFWLPNDLTWEEIQDLSSQKGINYPNLSELTPSIYIGFGLVLAQIVVQNGVFNAFAICLGLVRKEEARGSDSLKLLAKFNDSLWKLLCYGCLCLYGGATVLRKPWIWNREDFWQDYPFQMVDEDIKIYYLVEIGLYLSLLITHFLGPRRKDFWMLLVHHFATMGLLLLSWRMNSVRIGSAVILCHDVADIPLELGKIGNYLKAERLKNISFHAFAAIWGITRLGIFPLYLVRSVWEHYGSTLAPSFADSLCIGLLGVLMILHICWTYFILKVVVNVYVHNKRAEDSRSSDEDDNSEELRKVKGT